jgi:nicotinate dehydrogenase subunit B
VRSCRCGAHTHIIQAIQSAAKKTKEIHFKCDKIFDKQFSTYQIPRFSWVPKIETVLVEANNISSQGGGEPAIICMGGVIANAVYDATGARLFQLPITPEQLKEAMTKRA